MDPDDLTRPGSPTALATTYTPVGSLPHSSNIVLSECDNGDIYAMDADGSGVTRLHRVILVMALFSPDGSKIASINTDWNGNWEIYVMGADGANPTRLTSTVLDRRPFGHPGASRQSMQGEVRTGRQATAGLGGKETLSTAYRGVLRQGQQLRMALGARGSQSQTVSTLRPMGIPRSSP